MKSEEFNKCREFLENQIQASTDETYRNNLLQTYQKLLELKSTYDTDTDRALIEKEIKQAEFSAQTNQVHNANWHATQQNWQNNQASMHNNYHDNQANMTNNYNNAAFGYSQTIHNNNANVLNNAIQHNLFK